MSYDDIDFAIRFAYHINAMFFLPVNHMLEFAIKSPCIITSIASQIY